jgi:hypothetical protein
MQLDEEELQHIMDLLDMNIFHTKTNKLILDDGMRDQAIKYDKVIITKIKKMIKGENVEA